MAWFKKAGLCSLSSGIQGVFGIASIPGGEALDVPGDFLEDANSVPR